MSKKGKGGKAAKFVFVPDFSETPDGKPLVLGKCGQLWKESMENPGESLAPFEKESVLKDMKTQDPQWNNAIEQLILASDLKSGMINAVVTTFDEVKPGMKSFKNALMDKMKELPADDFIQNYIPSYIDHSYHLNESHNATAVSLSADEIEKLAPLKAQAPELPPAPGWDVLCAWSGVGFRKRHTLERELEQNGISVGNMKRAIKKYVRPVLPKYVKQGLSSDTLTAAHYYTKESPALYRIINGGLRAGDAKVLDKVVVFFHFLMEALNCLQGNTDETAPLWRGQDKIYGKDITTGGSITWDAFTSVSKEEAVAVQFAAAGKANEGSAPVVFKLLGVPAVCGGNLREISEFPNEAEILLPPGATFAVTKDSQEPEYRLLELQYQGVHTPTLQAGLGIASPLERETGLALSTACAWQSLASALRPEKDGRAALSLIKDHGSSLVPHINDKVPNTRGPPLWVAARNLRSAPLLKGMLALGADPQGTDTMGSTALHMCSFYGFAEGVKVLLEGDSQREETVLMLDKHGHTAVDMGKRYPEVVAAFEEFGITAAQNEASRPPSPLPASRAATPDIRARDVCGLIGLMPTPRSYGAALFNQRVASPTKEGVL